MMRAERLSGNSVKLWKRETTEDSVKTEADNMENRFRPGDIVQHFKRETLSDADREANKYLYEIVGVAVHSETREPMMVYRALYDDKGMYVRPLDMFLSEVDREKYPDIKQKYRFDFVK